MGYNKLLALSLFVLFAACGPGRIESREPVSQCQITYREDLKPADFTGVRLTPDYQLDIDGKQSAKYEEESAIAAADLFGRFHELPLSKMPACVAETYRLTWLPSFHRTTIVRVWSSTDGWFLAIKRLERTPDNKNGTSYTETTRQLTSTESEDLVHSINAYDFWNTSSTRTESLPNDGASWLIEGYRRNQYHNVFRISPDPALARIIRNMFALSGESTEIDKYLPDER